MAGVGENPIAARKPQQIIIGHEIGLIGDGDHRSGRGQGQLAGLVLMRRLARQLVAQGLRAGQGIPKRQDLWQRHQKRIAGDLRAGGRRVLITTARGKILKLIGGFERRALAKQGLGLRIRKAACVDLGIGVAHAVFFSRDMKNADHMGNDFSDFV